MDWDLIKQIKGLRSISQIGVATTAGNTIAAFFGFIWQISWVRKIMGN